MRAPLIVAATLAIACGDAASQTYRWVDEQGRVHYTQTPPPPGAKQAERKDFRSGAAARVDLPYATQLAAKNFPVTLYTQPDCGEPCDQARSVLVKRGVPFREVSVLSDKLVDEVKKVSGREELPLVVVGSQFHVGTQEKVINGLLDSAGYPAEGPRLPVDVLRKAEPVPPPAPALDAGPGPGDQSGAESR